MRSKIGECKVIGRWTSTHIGGQGQIFRSSSQEQYMFIKKARIVNFRKRHFYIEKAQLWFINSLEITKTVNVE